MLGMKTISFLRIVAAGHAFVQNLRRGHYEITVDMPTLHRVRVAFTELALCVQARSTASPAGSLVPELLGRGHLMTTDIDGAHLGVVAVGRGHHVRLVIGAGRGDPAQTLTRQVRDLRFGQFGHVRGTARTVSGSPSVTRHRQPQNRC
jgi:hypothetical protein